MIPGILIRAAEALVGPRWARPVAAVGLALAAVLLLWGAKCTYDGRVISEHDAKVTGKTLQIDAAAKDEAAEQRAHDTISITEAERERNEAINSEPAGRPDAARNRLNCQRLRTAGVDTSGFAECR
ncbi:MAG: hypothetical protein IE932_00020 [Sphingopyxis terrae]|nr:hypothetical protein [Sphingopyxis terrae]